MRTFIFEGMAAWVIKAVVPFVIIKLWYESERSIKILLPSLISFTSNYQHNLNKLIAIVKLNSWR